MDAVRGTDLIQRHKAGLAINELSCYWQRRWCYFGIVPDRKENLIVSNDV